MVYMSNVLVVAILVVMGVVLGVIFLRRWLYSTLSWVSDSDFELIEITNGRTVWWPHVGDYGYYTDGEFAGWFKFTEYLPLSKCTFKSRPRAEWIARNRVTSLYETTKT